MPRRRINRGAMFLLVALIIVGVAVPSRAQQSQLGKVDFPTSGSKEAQQHFLRGVAALHSFWYEEALAAFREATKVDPDFMMGYWGEAMAHNHPLWSEQDTEAARKVIAKIKDSPKLSKVERDFLSAVKALYGEGDKRARDLAYSAAMEKMYHVFTDDLEVASFYALSLLAIKRSEDKGYRLQARAGAIALDVYKKNPDHPGAAHYIIHAFDDPEHAIIALPAAHRYAQIAPDAHHARHMPSHIFLQLGMWPEAAASNESAWAVSDEWVRRKNLSISLRDYHSLHWLLYVYLQQGRYTKAEELLSLMQKTMQESKSENKLRPNYYSNNYANMASSFIVETERWQLASSLFQPVEGQAGEAGGEHAGHGGPQPAASAATMRRSNMGQVLPVFVRGLAAAALGSADAEKSLAKLQEMRKGSSSPDSYRAMPAEIRELEVAALAAASKKKYDEAINLMKKATALEEDLAPPSGPPNLIKPSHELFGEILLAAGRPKEAAEQFATALLRQPNRARSLIGAARAAAASGDANAAVTAYSKFLKQWERADSGLPELREAQDYLKQARTR